MLSSPNRVVALATPLIFAPAAGAVTAWAAKHAPGIHIHQGQLQAIFIAGATIALAHSGMWMKGWQDYEKRQEVLPASALEPADAAAAAAQPDVDAGTDADFDTDFDTDIDADIDPDAAAADLDEDDDDDPIAQLEAALTAAAAGATQDEEA
jgi:hypothetical protein